jgi:long-subunit fatty acid transport protein
MIGKFTLILSILTVLIFCVMPLQAQRLDQFVLNGSGARAAGMGNAFTGVADDATAMSWNTAGLTQLYTMEASVVGRFSIGTLNTDYSYNEIDVERSSKFQLNFASFAFPFAVGDFNIVGGLSFRRLYDFTEKLTYKASGAFGDMEAFQEYEGGINAITPALGIQLSDVFAVGAGINVLTGSLEYSGEDFDGNPLGNTSTDDYSGAAIDLGVLVKPNQQLSIGANFNLPYVLTVEGTGDDDFGFGTETYTTDLNVPFFFSVGLGFRATDKLLLAADFASRPWSSAEYEEDGEPLEDVEDANSIHFGLEYLLESGDNFLPLRLGFYAQPTPAKDANDDQITFGVLTAGLGLVMEKLILDSAIEVVLGNYIGDTERDAFNATRDVEYTQSDIRFTFGAALHLGD